LGAEIKFLEDATVRQMEEAMSAEADELRRQNLNPYLIPIGGSTALGSLGYVTAMQELASQLDAEDKAPLVFVAVGSGGTFAGCALGLRLFLPEAQLIGISVARTTKPLAQEAASHANDAAKMIDAPEAFDWREMTINDDYYGERYGVPSEPGNNAIMLAAKTEGLILDPIYTGKAMSGLVDLAKSKSIDTDRTVVFIHTGGVPGLMAFEDKFRSQAQFKFVR